MTQYCQTEILITACQSGDRLALAKLLARHHPELRARAEARMDPALKTRLDPDDILQEVYIDVARQIDQFENRGPGSFLAWVQAILNQKLVNARRAVHREMRDVDREVPADRPVADSYWNLLDALYVDSGTPSRVVQRHEALSALFVSLADLSDSHRQLIQLRFLDGLSVAEVARRLGKSEAAVVALSKRALEALRQAVDRLGDFSRGA
ncbi:MAG: RNA polymerase sigma factor [Planctomycetes bacterium]|nr:RNA polymerase sigma factor [Planctomycetota bacterium]